MEEDFKIETTDVNVEEFSRERLMEDVRQYPCIYNKYDKDYPNKTAKNKAWITIAAKYGITTIDADKKYKTMRSSYTRYLKKKRNTPPGMKPPPVPIAFRNLGWLANHIDHKETATNTRMATNENGLKSNEYQDEEPTDEDETFEGTYGEITQEENQDNSVIDTPPLSMATRVQRAHPVPTALPHITTTNFQQEEMANPPASNPTTSSKAITMYYNTPKAHETSSDTVLNLIPLESIQPSSSTPTQQPSDGVGKRRRVECDDEDELFCLSLVPNLKRLGPRNRTIAKMRFQQVLFDLEFPEKE